MNIGVDARVLGRFKTGIGVTLENLLLEMLKSDTGNNYFLFSNKPFDFPTEKSSSWRKIIKSGTFGKVGTLWQQFEVPRLLKEYKIDLFWSHEFVLPLFAPSKTKLIVSIHDLTYKYYPESMKKTNYYINKFFIPISIKKSSHILVDSEATKKSILKEFSYADEKKITPCHFANPLKTTQKAPSIETYEKHNIKGEYILSVGSIEPRKNLACLIKAYEKLNPKDLKLVIVGASGWKSDELLEKLGSKKNSNIILLQNLNSSELKTIYEGAKLFVFPSLYEGFGLPILEAMGEGVPVISSNTSSLPEVAGEAAIYFDPNNSDELADKINETLNSPETLKKYSDLSLDREKLFTWKKSAESLKSIFKKAVEA